jgi:hypothetical protein
VVVGTCGERLLCSWLKQVGCLVFVSVHNRLQVVFVLNADDSGHIQTPVPGTRGGPDLQRGIEWLLVDGMTVSQHSCLLFSMADSARCRQLSGTR